jgi:hypothetical protein
MFRSVLRNLFGSAPARKTRPTHAALRLEALEDRQVPTVTVTPINIIHENAPATTSLSISGDGNNNTINITSNGRGGITVVGDGRASTFTGIDVVSVATSRGADTVTFNQAAVQISRLALSVSLDDSGLFAQGFDDRFTANLAGAIGDGVAGSGDGARRLSIFVDGGGGNDRLAVNALGLNVAARADLSVDLRGSGGRDTLSVLDSGVLNGIFHMRAEGGDNADTVTAQVTMAAGSTGTLTGLNGQAARVAGNNGADVLDFRVFKNSAGGVVNAQIDAGFDADHDTVTHTANVSTAFVNPFPFIGTDDEFPV